jgi:hypothetical protein
VGGGVAIACCCDVASQLTGDPCQGAEAEHDSKGSGLVGKSRPLAPPGVGSHGAKKACDI